MNQKQAQRRALLGGTMGLAVGGLLAGPAAAIPPSAEDAAVTSIRRMRIPRTGELLPVVGLGTSRTFDRDPAGDNADLAEVLARFLAWGGSLVDSSPMYGKSEAMVGALAEGLGRGDLFYATKVWTKDGKQAGIDQMQRSAELMGTPRFDLMQVHNLVGLDEHLPTLEAWREEGRVRYIGVTEMRDFATVERLVKSGVLDFVQVPYSVGDRRMEERILPACLDHGVGVLVMRPYQKGDLFGAVKDKPLPEWAADFGAASWGQLFLKYILGHPARPIPIPATTKPHHLDDNMAAGVGPALDEAARARLVAILEA
ncbi:MAG: aldo/keto reductase [Planctomycetota bacterium]|nr:aldo/keto reductase [Planctomycetota bacterium]